ncbi:MAG: hypothetical protein ACPGXK_10615 [Phycisphaerae bacterium]
MRSASSGNFKDTKQATAVSGSLRLHWSAIGAALVLLFGVAGLALPLPSGGSSQTSLGTTIEDFHQPGSQPTGEVQYAEFVSSSNCRLCHEFQPAAEDEDPQHTAIYREWSGSMMGQSARDPMLYACLAIAQQDAPGAGDMCLRCHTAGAWISGRSDPPDGSALRALDRDGVSCSVCHRMVDPVLKVDSPFPDAGILANIDPLPLYPGGGNFVMDPEDRRRGPFDDVTPPHQWLASPFHTRSEMCATCHDVSNPMYVRQDDGTYALGTLNAAHPTADKFDMFPIERTYSEWLNSEFATFGVDMGGRFGGNKTVVSSCQDCHMPDVTGQGCIIPGTPVRDNMPSHELAGGNAWAQDMIWNLYGENGIIADDNLNYEYLQRGKDAAREMLERAATLELSQTGNSVNVRIVNETGHKLPTGYPEGRRMWINVVFYDDTMQVLAERGHYDDVTAWLTTTDTKVYECQLGIDDDVSVATGLPAGKTFHFVLNNVVLKDNRIPPRGFTNTAFEDVQAAPVAASYADGQYWDDTLYDIPPGTSRVDVSLYYQSASREFIEFLRDTNVTNDAGDILYEQWDITGKSPPVLMASTSMNVSLFGDPNDDGSVNGLDYAIYYLCLTGPDGTYAPGSFCTDLDADTDDTIDLHDFASVANAYTD